jgi:hypothetical protein
MGAVEIEHTLLTHVLVVEAAVIGAERPVGVNDQADGVRSARRGNGSGDIEVLPSRGCMWMLTRQDMVIRETIPPAYARHPSERYLGRAGAGGQGCRQVPCMSQTPPPVTIDWTEQRAFLGRSLYVWQVNLASLLAVLFVAFVGFYFSSPFLPLLVRHLGVTDPRAVAIWSGPPWEGSSPTTSAFARPSSARAL